jgi:hypothetical protein
MIVKEREEGSVRKCKFLNPKEYYLENDERMGRSEFFWGNVVRAKGVKIDDKLLSSPILMNLNVNISSCSW